jgi:hypothetical protein
MHSVSSTSCCTRQVVSHDSHVFTRHVAPVSRDLSRRAEVLYRDIAGGKPPHSQIKHDRPKTAGGRKKLRHVHFVIASKLRF